MTGTRSHTLVLTGDAGIKSAQNVAASLKEAIAAYPDICVDTQTVSAADITTVQTLLAAQAAAAAESKSFMILAPLGKPLVAVLGQAGFLTEGQEHAGLWSPTFDQPTGRIP
jgi:ABC-type transporter Mla MlaB component